MASEGTGGRESVFSAENEIEVQHGQASMVLMHSGRILAWRTSDFAGRPTVRLPLTAGPGARVGLRCPRAGPTLVKLDGREVAVGTPAKVTLRCGRARAILADGGLTLVCKWFESDDVVLFGLGTDVCIN